MTDQPALGLPPEPQSEATHRLLFEHSPQPMYAYDVHSLAFLAVNDAAIEQYGYSREEFLAMSLKDLRLPEDVPALLEVVPKLQRKETTGHTWRHRKKNGAIIWVQVNSHALPFGGRSARLALATDITERKRAEEALREAELRYRTLFAQSPDGVLIIDPATTLPLEFNDAVCQQSGYSREEFARLRLTDHDPVATPQEIQASIANIIEGRPQDFEVKHRTKQGELRAVHVTAQRIDLSGRPVIHCIWRDITERKKAEAEREMLFTSLREALANVKTLSGLLPICAGCKQIRDDQGYWNRIETYIQKHSHAQFTHGLCPDCIKKYYPDIDLSPEAR